MFAAAIAAPCGLRAPPSLPRHLSCISKAPVVKADAIGARRFYVRESLRAGASFGATPAPATFEIVAAGRRTAADDDDPNTAYSLSPEPVSFGDPALDEDYTLPTTFLDDDEPLDRRDDPFARPSQDDVFERHDIPDFDAPARPRRGAATSSRGGREPRGQRGRPPGRRTGYSQYEDDRSAYGEPRRRRRSRFDNPRSVPAKQDDGRSEGFLNFRGQQIWYRIEGSEDGFGKAPILCMHGGPGVPSDYLFPLGEMAKRGRRVVFFDQLGCGRSSSDEDPKVLQMIEEGGMEIFREQVRFVRQELKLFKCHLFGQSWGGAIALEHVLEQNPGVVSLTLESTPPSIAVFMAAVNSLVTQLSPESQQALKSFSEHNDPRNAEYLRAMEEFNNNFLCRLKPWPEPLREAYQRASRLFRGVGRVRDWTVADRLGEVEVATLLCSGQHDEVVPEIMEEMEGKMRDAEWVVFDDSAHMAHLEEPELFMDTWDYFLTRSEARLSEASHHTA
eukprot:tig00001086_g6849.t1